VTKERKKTLLVAAGCAIGVLVVLVGGYMTLVSPKKSKVASLQKDIAASQTKVATALAAARHPARRQQNHAPDLFRLAKAMPDQVDIAGAILDLDATARAAGVALDGITPSTPVAGTGNYQSVPIDVVMHGRYGGFTNFLRALKQLVVVRHGTVHAHGRLFGVDSVQFAEGDDKFPQLKATIALEAYTYGPSSATSTTTATTTGTTTTTTTNSSTSGSTSVSATGATH
jgi:Tfp pilus assembly protein PilO